MMSGSAEEKTVMRRVLARRFAVVVFLTLVAMLCHTALPNGPGAADAADRVLTVAIDANPSSLDIQDAQTFLTGLVLGIHVYDRLFEQSPSGMKPQLAERWETSADGRTWTFHLRRGVKFHDGTPFNAAAVKEGIARVVNPELKLRQASKFAGITSVDVVNEHTIRLTTNRPLGALPGNLSHQAGGSIQSPAAAKAGKFPVGTGPYRFVEYVPDERLVLAANKDYWGGAPSLDRLVFRIVPEARTRLAMLQSGEAQVIYNVAPTEFEGLRKDPNITVSVPPSAGWRVYGFNTQRKPYSDVRVRQALNHAVDKAAIVKNLQGRRPRGGLAIRPRHVCLYTRHELRLRSGPGQEASRRGRVPERLQGDHARLSRGDRGRCGGGRRRPGLSAAGGCPSRDRITRAGGVARRTDQACRGEPDRDLPVPVRRGGSRCAAAGPPLQGMASPPQCGLL